MRYYTRNDCPGAIWKGSKKEFFILDNTLPGTKNGKWNISGCYPSCFTQKLGGKSFRTFKAARQHTGI